MWSCGDTPAELVEEESEKQAVISPAWSVWVGKADYDYTFERVACSALDERRQNHPDAGLAPELSWTLQAAVDCSNSDAVALTTTITGSFSYEFALVWSAEGYDIFVVPGSFSQSNDAACAIESPSSIVSCTGSEMARSFVDSVAETDGVVRGRLGSAVYAVADWRDSKSYSIVNTPSGAAWGGATFTTQESSASTGDLPAWEVSVAELFNNDGISQVATASSGDTTSSTSSDGSARGTLTHTASVALNPIRITSPAGDPSESIGQPYVNEFAYELGVLEVPLEAKIWGSHALQKAPAWLESRLSWTFDPVGDSHDSNPSVPSEQVQTRWCPWGTTGPCPGGAGSAGSVTRVGSAYRVRLELERLPRRYDDFGPKTFALSFTPEPFEAPYQAGEAVAELFFDPFAYDHPATGSIAMTQEELWVPLDGRDPTQGVDEYLYATEGPEPNWAYYYTQIIMDLFEPEFDIRYVSELRAGDRPFNAVAPKMHDWAHYQGSPDTVWLGRGGIGNQTNTFGDDTFGINAFANLLAHEGLHVEDFYLMSDPANCGNYVINSLEPDELHSGWAFSSRGYVIQENHQAFNRYVEEGGKGFNASQDTLLDADGDGVCDTFDTVGPNESELEIRADGAMRVERCRPQSWNTSTCDLARLDWGADGFNFGERGRYGF